LCGDGHDGFVVGGGGGIVVVVMVRIRGRRRRVIQIPNEVYSGESWNCFR
jgi:hypothetical protein